MCYERRVAPWRRGAAAASKKLDTIRAAIGVPFRAAQPQVGTTDSVGLTQSIKPAPIIAHHSPGWALVYFTSGSIGEPKLLTFAPGVPVPQLTMIVEVHWVEGEALPAGEIGCIALKTPERMTGYIGLPDKAAETISNGWVCGDCIGYCDKCGFVHLMDRSSFAIERYGKPFCPHRQLTEHPDVATAILAQVQVAETARLCAIMVRYAIATIEADDMRRLLFGHFPLTVDGVLFLNVLLLKPVSGKLERPRLQTMISHILGSRRWARAEPC